MNTQPEELATLKRVREMTGMGTTYIYTMRGDPKNPFPAHIKVGRRSMWVVSEVHAWIHRQIDSSRDKV
ncbi:AlpA family phage regulatory protein [Pseudoxanthomonas winnipegensis]|uniref:AlpA family phage regulatory protein n=2 Tax=Pseudoxanthomonas winnipegensis TaxID=2480810 RepID=A0A4Q8M3F3_9GAMM|nr:AlpA family phage regulatory protein [Pseudoxanthomonas winnipegensis]